MKTVVSKSGRQILINGKPVYSEIPGVNPQSLGHLWNQRVIQGVFDDKVDPRRFDLFKKGRFDPEDNANDLIASLPAWYAYGLRAITVGFQGGWPVNCIDVREIDNNPFGSDGTVLDPAYAGRMDRIIRAADEIGMVVIVSLLYWAQSRQLKDGRAIVDAVKTGARFIKDHGYTNVILEIANEYNISPFKNHPLVFEAEGMTCLMDIAREHSGGVMVGSSGGGGMVDEQVVKSSDIVLIHGNGLSAGEYYDFVERVKAWAPDRPIVCNEDSPCCTRVDVALATGTSWGYYNNYTKQIPPADYGITPGEDLFFARRVARAVGIPVAELTVDEQFYLQGLEPHTAFHGKRAIRLAAEFPEKIVKVEFYKNDTLVYASYDEPFFYKRETTWLSTPWDVDAAVSEWKAVVYLTDGTQIVKSASQGQVTQK